MAKKHIGIENYRIFDYQFKASAIYLRQHLLKTNTTRDSLAATEKLQLSVDKKRIREKRGTVVNTYITQGMFDIGNRQMAIHYWLEVVLKHNGIFILDVTANKFNKILKMRNIPEHYESIVFGKVENLKRYKHHRLANPIVID